MTQKGTQLEWKTVRRAVMRTKQRRIKIVEVVPIVWQEATHFSADAKHSVFSSTVERGCIGALLSISSIEDSLMSWYFGHWKEGAPPSLSPSEEWWERRALCLECYWPDTFRNANLFPKLARRPSPPLTPVRCLSGCVELPLPPSTSRWWWEGQQVGLQRPVQQCTPGGRQSSHPHTLFSTAGLEWG